MSRVSLATPSRPTVIVRWCEFGERTVEPNPAGFAYAKWPPGVEPGGRHRLRARCADPRSTFHSGRTQLMLFPSTAWMPVQKQSRDRWNKEEEDRHTARHGISSSECPSARNGRSTCSKAWALLRARSASAPGNTIPNSSPASSAMTSPARVLPALTGTGTPHRGVGPRAVPREWSRTTARSLARCRGGWRRGCRPRPAAPSRGSPSCGRLRPCR